MKTEVEMKRELFGDIISQKSKSGFFNASELMYVGNKYRIANNQPITSLNSYFRTQAGKEFTEALAKKYGEVKKSTRGRNGAVWVHPLLFLDIALWIDPQMKIEVYEWLMDNLLKFRNNSGDGYKRMCGALYGKAKNKSLFSQNIQHVARLIKKECGVSDWDKASEEQLALREQMQDYIAFACDMTSDANTAVIVGIRKAKEKR